MRFNTKICIIIVFNKIMEIVHQVSNRASSFKTLRKYVFAFIVFLTVFQQFPFIRESFYSEFRFLLYLLFGLFAITSIFSIRNWISHISIKLFVFAIFSTIIINIIYLILGFSLSFELIFEFLIPFGIIVCSLSLDLNEKELNNFLFVYILLSLFMGICTIYYYGDGFVISATPYIVEHKNQIGPLLGISALIVLLSIFDKKILNIKFLGLIPKIVLFSLLFACILIVRNRAGAFALIITAIFYLLISKNILFNLKFFFASLIIIWVFVFFYFLGPLQIILNFIWESFTKNYDIFDLDNLSAFRLHVLIDATVYIRENPLFGTLGGTPFSSGIIHNYLLAKWVNYGMILSLPIAILYIYLYFFVFNNILKKNNSLALLVGWLMFFFLIISNFEYSFPFGPGIPLLMLWFLFGVSLKSTKSKHNNFYYN
jgi:hypothetical protein